MADQFKDAMDRLDARNEALGGAATLSPAAQAKILDDYQKAMHDGTFSSMNIYDEIKQGHALDAASGAPHMAPDHAAGAASYASPVPGSGLGALDGSAMAADAEFEVTAVDPADVPADAVVVGGYAEGASDAAAHSAVGETADASDRDADIARHQTNADEYRAEQAAAVARGDYAAAGEAARQVEGELHAMADRGAGVDAALDQTQKDEANLSWSEYHQGIVKADAQAAEWYLSGDEVTVSDATHAEALLDHAGDHAGTAADYGHAADAGGPSADHAVTVDHGPDPSLTD